MTHEPGDPASLAHALDRLSTDAALRARIAAAARATAVERFDARRLGAEFAALYEAALDRAVASR
jgi:glycosyltransferase involved in cell wall biosynthesis